MIAIACAVSTGPLLAHAAIGIRDYANSAPDEDGFSLDAAGVFVDPGTYPGLYSDGLTPQQGCDEPWISCVVSGGGGDDWWPGGGGMGGGGTGGGSSGGDCSADPSRCEGGNPPPTGPEALRVLGRNCPAELTAAETAKNLLYANSPTARAMMDAAVAHGVYIQIIQHNIAQQGGQANNRFDPITGVITWDPFLAAFGNNLNGSPYSQSPIMALAHELVHGAHRYNPAYQGVDNEAIIMELTNQIAAEMNAATQSNYHASRDNHLRTHQGYVTSVTSAEYSIGNRPACD